MSNQELVVPGDLSYLSNLISEDDSTLKDMLEGSASAPYIKASNGEFTLVIGKDNTEALGTSLECIIVGVNMKQRSYYKDNYVPGSSSPPDCCSCDGVTPDKAIKTPCAKKCQDCENAVRGSGKAFTPGALVSACAEQPKLIIVPAADVLEQEPKLYALHIKRGSIANLKGFAKRLAEMSIPSTAFVKVQLGFNKVGQNNQLTFTVKAVLDQASAIKMRDLTVSKQIKDMLFAESQFKTDDSVKDAPIKTVRKTKKADISDAEIEEEIDSNFEGELDDIMGELED